MTPPGSGVGVAVATPHHEATAAAEQAIANGGNAIDAALAAATVLTVVYPHQCSLGGDLLAVVREPDGSVSAVLSAGAAAAGIDVDAVRGQHDRMPGRGPLSVTVPGVVAGWIELAGRGARLPLADALVRAADIAAMGTPVSAGLHRTLLANAELLWKDPGARRTFFDESGEPIAEGALWSQPALSATLRRLASDPTDFYTGQIARVLGEGFAALGSPLTADDLAAHRVEVTEPVVREIDGTTWYAAPAPSQASALLAVLGERARRTDAELFARGVRVAAARDALLADPHVADVDVERFFAAADGVEAFAAPTGPGAPKPAGDTVAVTAVDTEGRAVTLIQSVFQSFGSGLVEPRTGIVLHSRGSAFSLDPSHPAFLTPGARPPHTLSPVIAATDEGPDAPNTVMALGCQGGRAQAWILSQVAGDLIDPETSDLEEVLGRDRWVFGGVDIGRECQTLVVESDTVTPELAEIADTAGLATSARGTQWDEAGHVQVCRLVGTELSAASDPRADGEAVVLR
ncbi:gamma-glutamyltransferase [Prescottella equi]|uniref:gamma-glutamyltransferase n=1 Tax=Rhodococcus hoagii TaxID=43767 RepID=UPI0027405071|nr:gamma-glutamyltransferase [Prescottella equi]MDP8015161.1 gamma-glutamyltransferase [Prescottella equi]